MSTIFNSNTMYEVTVTKGCLAKYYDVVYSDRQCAWLVENAVPFNIIPLLNDFRSDSSHHWWPLFKYSTDDINYVDYGINFEQQNDIIIVYVSSYFQSLTNRREIARFTIGSIPSSYNIYFIFFNHELGTNSSLYIVYGNVDIIGVAPYTRPNNTRIMQQNSQFLDSPLTDCGIGSSIPLPYNANDTLDTESYFQYYPFKVMKWTRYSYIPSDNAWMIFQTAQTGSIDLQYVYSINNEDPVIPTPEEPPFDPSGDEPYPENPSRDDTSDDVPIPGNPLIGVTTAGFINVYSPGMGALQGLGDILFPNVASATDVMDAILKLCQTIANQNLINYVIDCHVIPVTPQLGNNSNIKVGFRDTGISVPVVTNDYVDATCGSLNLAEWFNGAADYSATRSKLYLPFIGFVDTKPEFWQAGTISVDYKFNVIDGSFMCYVKSSSSKSNLSNSVIAQYAGNACMHLPLTGVNYAQMVSGIIGAGVAAVSTGGTSAVLGAAASAANTLLRGGDVQQSNGYNSTAALMGVRSPYLMIERAVPAFPGKYGHDKGYPSNITTNLGNVSGYTEIEDIDLSGIPLTQAEIEELRGLLKEGVYF